MWLSLLVPWCLGYELVMSRHNGCRWLICCRVSGRQLMWGEMCKVSEFVIFAFASSVGDWLCFCDVVSAHSDCPFNWC